MNKKYKSIPTLCIDQGAGKSQCGVSNDVSPTLTTTHGGEPAVLDHNESRSLCLNDQGGQFMDVSENVTGTLRANAGGHLPSVIEPHTIGHDIRTSHFSNDGKTGSLTATDYKDSIKHSNGSKVRRLTPLECERLQGFPDNWTNIGTWTDTNGKKRITTDTARYKALGNSIALPFWQWLAHRIVAQFDEPPTMASLFDGIGGFPLVFSRAGCTPVWASEIEEFQIAVTKKHFPDEEEEI